MKQSIGLGMNRTGTKAAPLRSRQLVKPLSGELESPSPEPVELARVRREYGAEVGPIGTMPPPSSLREGITTAVEAIKGNKAIVLMDALGARAAFERTGSRLYEAMLAKVEALGTFEGGPTLEQLALVRDQEMAHFALVCDAIEKLGGDPTVQTPSADVNGTLSLGLVQVLTDPRTTVPQALHALHTAELVDNDAWLLLSTLTSEMGHAELAERFERAERQEQDHLASVRAWMRAALTKDAEMDFETAPAGSE